VDGLLGVALARVDGLLLGWGVGRDEAAARRFSACSAPAADQFALKRLCQRVDVCFRSNLHVAEC